MPIIKRCKQCNISFRTKREKQVFCSVLCKSESQKLKVVYKCTGCGNNFLNYPYLKRKTNYCSLDCYYNSTRTEIKRSCLVCKKLFFAPLPSVKKGFGKFCSRACQHTLYPKKIVKYCLQCGARIETQPSKQLLVKFCSKKCADDHTRDYVSRICQHCKKEFQIPSSSVNRGGGLFCSWQCFKKYRGETSIEKKIRECLEQFHIKFRQEAKIGRYHADFLIENTKIIIECDGIYWHSLEHARKRDVRKNAFLKEKGYRIYRFPEEEINQSPLTCLRKIFDFSYV